VDGRVLGHDRDALLALQVDRVHDPLRHVLVGAEDAGLPEHGVDQGGLAVVDVAMMATFRMSGRCGIPFTLPRPSDKMATGSAVGHNDASTPFSTVKEDSS
jgi:hypothetical protein